MFFCLFLKSDIELALISPGKTNGIVCGKGETAEMCLVFSVSICRWFNLVRSCNGRMLRCQHAPIIYCMCAPPRTFSMRCSSCLRCSVREWMFFSRTSCSASCSARSPASYRSAASCKDQKKKKEKDSSCTERHTGIRPSVKSPCWRPRPPGNVFSVSERCFLSSPSLRPALLSASPGFLSPASPWSLFVSALPYAASGRLVPTNRNILCWNRKTLRIMNQSFYLKP